MTLKVRPVETLKLIKFQDKTYRILTEGEDVLPGDMSWTKTGELPTSPGQTLVEWRHTEAKVTLEDTNNYYREIEVVV